MYKKITSSWPLLLLIILTFVLRIINLEQLFYFTYDESIPAFVGRRLFLWNHVPLIGGVTPFGFHLAPYFYWFYSVILFLGNFNPIAWGYASAAIAALTALIIFIVAKSFANKKVAILASAFWTFSYLSNVYDRHLWALYWGPLTSLISLIALYKILKGNHNFVYLLAATIALSVHADPSNLVFLALAIVSWIIFRIPIKKSTYIALGIILLSFLPLAVFDLRHDFANTKPVLEFWNQGRNNPGFEIQKFADNAILFPRTFSRLIYTFGDQEVSKQYSYCKTFVKEKFDAIPPLLVLLSALTIFGFVIWAVTKSDSKSGWKLISLLIILYFLGIQLYGTILRADIFEHYITGIFPVLLIILGKLISVLPRPIWLVILTIFISTNLFKLLQAENNLGLTNKREAIEFTMQQIGDRPFSLDSLSTCWKLSGYRYLFIPFGREPAKSYVDPNLSYLYGTTQVSQQHPETVVAFVAHDFVPETEDFYKRYAILKSHEVKNAIFGNLEVIIMDNTGDWFDQTENIKNPNIPVSTN